MSCACASAGCWKVSDPALGADAAVAAALGPLGDGMVEKLGDLGAVLRAQGTRVGVGELLAAVRSLEVVDCAARDDVRLALRAVLCSQHIDLERFDLAFVAVFGDGSVPGADGVDPLGALGHIQRPAPVMGLSDPGGAVADHLRPDRGAQPVGADEDAAGDPLARPQDGGGTTIDRLVAGDVAAGPELDRGLPFACGDEGAMKLAAMHHGVGIAEPLAKRAGHVDMGDLLAGDRVHQAQFVDEHRFRAGDLAESQAVEGVKRVGPELDAGADLFELRCPFEDRDGEALVGERQRGGKAAYAPAGDDDPFFLHGASSMIVGYSRCFLAPGFGSPLGGGPTGNFFPAVAIRASISPRAISTSSWSRLS